MPSKVALRAHLSDVVFSPWHRPRIQEWDELAKSRGQRLEELELSGYSTGRGRRHMEKALKIRVMVCQNLWPNPLCAE